MHAHARLDAGPRRHVGQEQEVAALAADRHQVMFQRLRQADLVQHAQRVPCRHHEHQFIDAVADELQPAQVDGAGHQADVGAAFDHRAHAVFAQVLFEVDVDVGIGGQEAAQRGRQAGHGAAVGVDPDMPFGAVGMALHLALQAFHVFHDGLRVAQYRFAGRCQRHALLGAVEQRHAHRLFQVLETVARRRRRQVHIRGAAGDAPGLCDGKEYAQVGQFETHACLRFPAMPAGALEDF
ncbi:hypothetical protein D3C81_1218540 [compost metagenome]